MRIRAGKTGSRVVALDPEASAILALWLERRKALGANGHQPAFCTITQAGGRLSQPWVRGLLRRLAKKAGIDKRVHAHGLRHSFAQDLAMEGQPLLVIQQALGHKHASTTSEYLHDILPAQLLDALRNRPAWAE